ncbi:MAG: zinc metallopeptidase [Armatimonadota bacterium]|nr:zinc metallopeptidase [Armatimonadota bacterium]MDR7427911.1 zinc metallopeptidase [Armatimonadota bacterium]MDR7464180.1 zinc metallopeptidase [Armatimonadota bacterium]MDR7470597.1 zinc metallopeptidase [Armatimonadota bacterium]MDR7475693.1 zinc metallopeptidase [Armatimonadota bacterium]
MPFLFYDPTFVLLLPALALALYAQLKVSGTFNRYAQVPSARGMTGAEVAVELLRRRGVRDVRVEPVGGLLAAGLSDHYDPRSKTLRLSAQVYGSTSVAAIGVAAHEAGHALQHREGYAPLALRTAIVPVAQFGTMAAWVLFALGLITSQPMLMDLGILLFLGYILFSLVTLPVEFNASSRAVAVLQGEGFVLPQEAQGVREVLNAAALTYVAAAFMAVMQLVRLLVLRGMTRDE